MTLQSNERWVYPEKVNEKVLGKYKDVSSVVASLLHSRGIIPEDVDNFLNPSLEQIASYKKLHNSKKAAKEILKAVNEGKRIYIHGDFDVDGICATAMLWEFLYKELPKAIGRKVDVLPYIPKRVDEGYGLSKLSVDAMLKDGAQLIITVDCGIRDRELIEKYSKKANFIVTDHHQPPEDVKSAKYTIVHQMFPGKEYPEQKICGSAVAFLLIQAIRDEAGMDTTITADTPGLDLVGLATVTDMMPLLGINRVFVRYGIEQMKKGERPGMKAIIQTASVAAESLDSYHFGFVIGPRINAAGRIGDAMDALRLLVSDDKAQVSLLAAKLHNLNALRQEKTNTTITEALMTVDQLATDMLVFISGKDWEEGIIGLVAGRMFEKFRRPVVVVTEINGEMRGSARSPMYFNITDAIGMHAEHLVKYGGHAQAAGFNVKEGELEKFREKLVKFANENITPDMLSNDLEVDLQLSLADINQDLFDEIERLKPFGYGNRKPLIAIEDVQIGDVFEMSGGRHAKLKLTDMDLTLTAVLFNCDEDIRELLVGRTISVIGSLDMNHWNGNSELQFQVKGWK
jgi:single-stranded-DNA-specific exonuclease